MSHGLRCTGKVHVKMLEDPKNIWKETLKSSYHYSNRIWRLERKLLQKILRIHYHEEWHRLTIIPQNAKKDALLTNPQWIIKGKAVTSKRPTSTHLWEPLQKIRALGWRHTHTMLKHVGIMRTYSVRDWLLIEFYLVDWCWSWNSSTLATWCEELTHWKRPWCWARLKAGEEGDDRGWDG